jgi:predicted MPP superfamily phosphohydrolase
MRRRWWIPVGVIILGFGFLGWSVGIEPGLLSIKGVEFESERWQADQPLRVAVIADIHTGAPHIDLDKVSQVVRRTNALKPDLILLAGDYVIQGVLFGRFVPPEQTANRLGALRARYGVYAVLGNHDWWFNGNRVRKALQGVGINVLENEAVPFNLPSGRIWIAGIADDTTRNPQPVRTLANIQRGEPVIVFTHDPAIFPDVPDRVLLTLAGHTHGGQIYIPWIGAIITPGRAPLRHAYGLIREAGKAMYVTSGIGTSILPIRLNMPPEIALIKIKSRLQENSAHTSKRK